MSDLNMPHGKMSDFALFSLFGLTLVIRLRNCNFENHWNTLMFLDKKSDVRFEYVLSNSVWWFALTYELNFGNKLRNTSFKLYWNSFIFFSNNDRNLLSYQKLSQFFCLICILWHYYGNTIKKFLMVSRYIEKLQKKIVFKRL